MSDKVTLQSVAESFSRSCGVPKKVAEQLARAFFDTVIDGLSTDESVKINGLGTFRVVEVASRESINVTNGERIVIAGYKKVNFVPEDGMLVSNLIGDMPDVHEEVESDSYEVEAANEVPVEEDANDVDCVEPEVVDETEDVAETESVSEEYDAVDAEINMVSAPEKVEIREDDFSGIDMLICTPESVEEIRLELEQARLDAEKKLAAAKDAYREVLRLEVLLEKMENGIVPESVIEDEEDAPEAESEEEVVVAVEQPVPMVAETVVTGNAPICVELPKVDEVEATESEVESAEVAEVSETQEEDSEPVAEIAENNGTPQEEEPISVDVESAGAETSSDEDVDATETVPEASVEAEAPAETDTVEATESDKPEEGNQAASDSSSEALNRLLADKPTSSQIVEKPKKKKEDKNYLAYIFIPLLSVLVIGLAIVFFTSRSQSEKDELKQLPVKPKNEVAPAPKRVEATPRKDTISSKPADVEKKAEETQVSNAASKTSEAAKGKSSAPKKYVLKKGESLTKVSQMFYNTKDSVRAIIRVNNFKDVDNVPYGTEINLP